MEGDLVHRDHAADGDEGAKALNAEVVCLREELEASRLRLRVTQEVEARIGNVGRTGGSLPLPRRIERFRGRPAKASDPCIVEWVADMKVHLASHWGSKEEMCLSCDHQSARFRG